MIECEIYGLKCDASNCDYEDMSIPFEDYPKHINAPCPNCGSNLLTQEDYNTTLAMVSLAKAFSNAFPQESSGPVHKVDVELNGSGIPQFKV